MSTRNMNTVALSGNTVAVPFVNENNGKTFATVTIAANRRAYRNDDGTWDQKADYIPVEISGKAAERFKNLPAGSAVTLTGSLESYSYQKDDITVYGLRVHATDIISIIEKN